MAAKKKHFSEGSKVSVPFGAFEKIKRKAGSLAYLISNAERCLNGKELLQYITAICLLHKIIT